MTSFVLAIWLSVSASSGPGPILVPGAAWQGRDHAARDFSFVDPTIGSDRLVRYQYFSMSGAGSSGARGGGARRETCVMEFFPEHGARFRGVIHERGRLRIFEGKLVPDGRFVMALGRTWTTDAAETRVLFWATIDALSTLPAPSRIDLNHVTVGELMAAGASASAARTLVGGRVEYGPYRSVADALAAPGLTRKEIDLLKSKAYVP